VKPDSFSSGPLPLSLEWGRRGVQRAAARGDAIIAVDVLSFSTVAAIAASRGASLLPCRDASEAEALARQTGAQAAPAGRSKKRFSLSPAGCLQIETGSRLVLASPNGATCCGLAREAPALLVGALVNARASAEAAAHLARATGAAGIAVIACGERWAPPEPDEPGEEIRFALEDWLGAGAILSHLEGDKSADARAAEATFRVNQERLADLIRDCPSGRELIDRGFPEDVELAVRLNAFAAVPVRGAGGWLEPWRDPDFSAAAFSA
jgi:2-phosphosulfolactate phosphatase